MNLNKYLSVAVVEHHYSATPSLDTYDIYDICEILEKLWEEIQEEIQLKIFSFELDCILASHERIATAFNSEPGMFRNKEDWGEFLDACGDIQESPTQVCSWVFSALYWNRLTKFRLSTVWLLVNAVRVQIGQPEYTLSIEKLGPFLESLSGSGPPLYDGETFYPDDYSIDMKHNK